MIERCGLPDRSALRRAAALADPRRRQRIQHPGDMMRVDGSRGSAMMMPAKPH
jgi:hypothetical protein